MACFRGLCVLGVGWVVGGEGFVCGLRVGERLLCTVTPVEAVLQRLK